MDIFSLSDARSLGREPLAFAGAEPENGAVAPLSLYCNEISQHHWHQTSQPGWYSYNIIVY